MYRAKRGGADRIEIFSPEMRGERDDRALPSRVTCVRRWKEPAQDRYQPIIYLPTEELAGFEALVRWEHPKLGMLKSRRFVPVAEDRISSSSWARTSYWARRSEAARWQRECPVRTRPLFVSVNVSSRQIFRQDLIQEIRHILGRQLVRRVR